MDVVKNNLYEEFLYMWEKTEGYGGRMGKRKTKG